jgi:hypothetical protein
VIAGENGRHHPEQARAARRHTLTATRDAPGKITPQALPVPAPGMTPAQIVAAVRRAAARLRFTTEAHLQEGLARLFAEAGIRARPQARLSRRDRPDFLIGTVAVEVKVKGSPAEVRRQLARYVAHDAVTAVVLVTRCARHRELAGQLGGKPVHVVWISGVTG